MDFHSCCFHFFYDFSKGLVAFGFFDFFQWFSKRNLRRTCTSFPQIVLQISHGSSKKCFCGISSKWIPTAIFQGDFYWKCPWKIFTKLDFKRFPPIFQKKNESGKLPLEIPKKNIEKKYKHFPLQENTKKGHKNNQQKNDTISKTSSVLDQGGIWFPNEEDSWNFGKTRRRAGGKVAHRGSHGCRTQVQQVPGCVFFKMHFFSVAIYFVFLVWFLEIADVHLFM